MGMFLKNHNYARIFIAVGALIVLIGFLTVFYIFEASEVVAPDAEVRVEHVDTQGVLDPKIVVAGKAAFHVVIADEPHERMRGLSFVDSMEEYEGMMFFFQEYGHYPFWMKDMKFDLDLIWIRDNTVVDISTYASSAPERQMDLYASLEPINIVLEVRAGLVDRYGIEVGDEVMFHNMIFVQAEKQD